MSANPDNDNFNADELVAPEWLNGQFITKVLSEHEKAPELKVTGLHFSPASAKGDHYASVMFRAKAEYTTRKGASIKSLIIKTMPEQEGHKKDMLGDSPIFKTEIGMYSKVLPEFESILRNAGDDAKLYVDCIYHSLEPRQVMIFEDLVEMGYTVIRDRELNLDEVRSVYSKLGKWHAASIKVQNEQPTVLKGYTTGLFEMPKFLEEVFIGTGITFFLELLDKEPELRKYKPYFESIKGDFLQGLKKEWTQMRQNPKPDQYYVLCHGDFHLRNMMFKHNKQTGVFEDCMLLDFQICSISPLTIDLIFSIYMLMEPQQRWDHWEDLLKHYFSVLVDTLKKIGYKGEMPTEDGLWQRLHQQKYYHFLLISTFLPLMWALREDGTDFGDLLQNNEKRRNCSFLEGYVKDVTILLPRLDQLGYFKQT
ncbi:uncharacterized protein LOC108154314 isoform X1 [Drosophila miranda]|uniref:uncharacterized protein LOC108154314 isoform X1 n=2 Tax=Drosophila miranda TaxID=7229 RepID=UPI0007E61C61|nr:uncharacterized protein LOC108154314 isoform X1 [Drosophila miranda]